MLERLEDFKLRLKDQKNESKNTKWMQNRLYFSIDSITAFKTEENRNKTE